MNRHHPYGGPYDGTPRRGGGSPSGPGPDRNHRFQDMRGGGPLRGRGGYGRGRGGYVGSFDGGLGHGAYDQGPPQGDIPPYNNYDNGPQDTFYQNGGYGEGLPPNQFGGPPDSYNQGYGNNYEGALEGLKTEIVWSNAQGAGTL